MARILGYMAASLDGFVARTDHRLDWLMKQKTDGEDHGSGLDQVAPGRRRAGIVVHALGVGTLEGQPLELPRLDPDDPVEYKRDAGSGGNRTAPGVDR